MIKSVLGENQGQWSTPRELYWMEATWEQSIPLQLHGVIKIQLELMDKLFPPRIIAAESIIKDIDVFLGKDFLKAE